MRSADGRALSDDGGGQSRADEAGVLVVEEQVCGRMLTYADVCWRMLTYADVR
jgi:hypothetical protein